MGLGGRPPIGPFEDMLYIRVERKFKEKLKKKCPELELSKLVRDLLRLWMSEHGCEKMNSELNVVTFLRVFDRFINEEFNAPRITYALPTMIFDGKMTHPLRDISPKGLSLLLFGE